MPIKLSIDKYLMATTISLLVIGVIMVYSASAVIALETVGDPYYYLKKQLLWVFIGLIGMLFTYSIDYNQFEKWAVPLVFLTVFLLLLIYVPQLGKQIKGARRWLKFGGFSFQPSELIKIVLILYLSKSLVKKENKLDDFTFGYLPNLLVLGLFFFIILNQPDLGTCVIISAVALLMFIVSGIRPLFIVSSVLMVLPFLVVAVYTVGWRMKRMWAFWDPWSDPYGAGFQIIQSFLAFGRGSIFGTGLGNGKQKLFYLPEPHTDFIFSVLGEELGFFGVLVVVILFGILIYRGLRAAIKCPDLFGKYVAFGLTTVIALQVITNMGVTAGLLPTKGITLPLISKGGSSMVVTLASIGILLNISEKNI